MTDITMELIGKENMKSGKEEIIKLLQDDSDKNSYLILGIAKKDTGLKSFALNNCDPIEGMMYMLMISKIRRKLTETLMSSIEKDLK